MSFSIRPATENDETEVIGLWRDCGLVTSYNDPSTDFRLARGKTNSDILIAADPARRLIGSIMVGHDGHRGWLYYVAVDPACRGQGVGRSLVHAAERWLTERGIAKVQLMVRETNMQVVEFYKRIGYDPMPRINMQKWLKASS
jgi:ribosomal protein S18 acetylase RimI-like enzyme